MKISYKKLWKTLIDRDLKKTDLARLANLSTYTINKMNSNENINIETIGKICLALNCKVDDILEIISEDHTSLDSENFEILSGDIVVALYKEGNLTIKDKSRLPLFLLNNSNAKEWLETRAIDTHRTNSRLLKKIVRLKEKDDLSTVMYVNGATITDNYWIRPINSLIKYENIKFSSDYFASLALRGDFNNFIEVNNEKDSRTPELTNTGSFEKCWKLMNNRWWMYKSASKEEMFSELFIYKLGKELNFNMAHYEKGDGYIKSLDFTVNNEFNFEPASSFLGTNEDYLFVIEQLHKIFPEGIKDYIQMIFLDTICFNVDRHTNNFGLLRNSKKGNIVGFAPNYDNNMALISRGYKDSNNNDLLIRLFNELLEKYPEYKEYIPYINKDLLEKVYLETDIDVNKDKVINMILERYCLIK